MLNPKIMRNIFIKLMFLASFVYFACFRFLMIPSGDDYFWYGENGNYLLHHFFYGPQNIYGGSSNGRYLGNLLEIITMHKLSVAMIVYAVFWTLLLWCLWYLSRKTISSLLLSFLFIFTLQDAFINNVLTWNAGFVNYVPPIVLSLIYIVIVDHGTSKKLNKFMIIPVFILALQRLS
ncbi:hypothetical protein [Companilactobacillus alimentarius]|uniref:hypothetical protein n=1 Tax=Companilactobacillus alimentarius TaxID=1602 RepID=UPI0028B433C9|nr:hypothetical protein [Companilactobacillus alimentarius]MDT6953090.1 hypothetical protein [Companilactobacillus alimentarius]